MLRHSSKRCWLWALALVLLVTVSQGAFAQTKSKPVAPLSSLGSAELIQPEQLVKALQSEATKPLVLNVGPRMLYMQAHIRGAEYIGQGSEPEALKDLRTRVKSLPRTKFIVLYCGCCPWSHCPNVLPAYNEMRSMGFKNVKVLYIATNIGVDWVYKGYPTTLNR